jgi:hypothetical protein
MAKKTLPVEKLTKAVPVKIVNDPVRSTKDDDYERKHKAKYALEDIERAEGHRRDKELMRDVKKLAKEKVKSLKEIC